MIPLEWTRNSMSYILYLDNRQKDDEWLVVIEEEEKKRHVFSLEKRLDTTDR
jgi:hypothetical protein